MEFTCSPLGQVVVGTGDPDVGHHGCVGPLWAAVRGGAGGGGRVQLQSGCWETLVEGLKFLCVEERRDRTASS